MSNESDYDDDESANDSVSSGNSFGTVDYPSSSDDDADSNDDRTGDHTMGSLFNPLANHPFNSPRVRTLFHNWNERRDIGLGPLSQAQLRMRPTESPINDAATPLARAHPSAESENDILTVMRDDEDTDGSSSHEEDSHDSSSDEEDAGIDSVAEDTTREMRDTLKCPITGGRLRDPVITPSGVTYSRAALARWLRTSRTDPSTRQPLLIAQVVPNRAVAALVKTLRKRKRMCADGSIATTANIAQVTTTISAL